MMLGCFSSLYIFTSLKQSSSSSFFSLLFLLNSSIFNRFSAYSFDPFFAKNTYPNAPCPNSSSKLQFPTTYNLKFLFFMIFPIFSNSSSMAYTFALSSSLNAFRVLRQASGGLTKCPISKKGPSNSEGKILLKIFLFFSSEQTYLSNLNSSTLNSSKACGSSCSSMSSNLIIWQLTGCDLTNSKMASSNPSSTYLELMSLSNIRWVRILMLQMVSLQSKGSLSLRLMRLVKLESLKSQITSVLVVRRRRQIQLRRAILSRKLPCALFSSVMSVVAPLILLKFSLNCALSSRSFMIPINFGLWAGSSLSKANTNLPTYQTSSNTLLNPRDMSSRVIQRMTLVASGLFMASRSMILQNISCVKD